jgi:phosphate:Na+ symporter
VQSLLPLKDSMLEFYERRPNESHFSMLSLLALFLAGLGLFFHGLSGLKQNMHGLTSRRVRTRLAAWSQHPALAGAWGVVLGALTQSVTAVAFIVASLVAGGLLTVRRALPIVACANVGTAVLVLVASFDVHLAVLLVLGTMGLAAAFDLGGRGRAILSALFFAALLFFGLRLMRDAFGPLPTLPWFAGVAKIAQSSLLATFLTGAVLRLFIQSSPAIAIIGITLSHGGLLSGDQVLAMIFGTGLGVGGAVILLSTNLRGVPRQIALYQALLSTTAGLVTGTLFAVEHFTGWPLLAHGLRQLPGPATLQLAYAFAAMQSVALLLALGSVRWAVTLLERLSPATVEQDLSRPAFIQDQALRDPESALVLAEKEQTRLLGRLPQLLEAIRSENVAVTTIPAEVLHDGTTAVAAEVRSFLHEIAEHDRSGDASAQVLALQHRDGLLTAASETTRDFVHAAGKLRAEPALAPLLESLVEGLHALTQTVVEAVAEPANADRALLLAMTADRGEMMEKLRRNVLNASPTLAHETKLQLLYATTLFEREVWLLRQLAQTIPAAQ